MARRRRRSRCRLVSIAARPPSCGKRSRLRRCVAGGAARSNGAIRAHGDRDGGHGAAPFGPLVAPPPTQLPRRHYFVVGVSPRGRKSDAVDAGLGCRSRPAAPRRVRRRSTYTESQMTITWTPSPDARDVDVPAAAAPVKPHQCVAEERDAACAAARRRCPRSRSASRPKRPRTTSTTCQPTRRRAGSVRRSERAGAADAAAAGRDRARDPKASSFGVERCFEVRPVDSVFGAPVHGPGVAAHLHHADGHVPAGGAAIARGDCRQPA